jgi:hypothetical protein
VNWQAISGNPFFTVALPLLIGMFVTGLWQGRGFTHLGKRIDDLKNTMNERFTDVGKRLDWIDSRLDRIDGRLKSIPTK